MKMALKNPSANCFRKFKGLQLTFQVVTTSPVPSVSEEASASSRVRSPSGTVHGPRRPARVAGIFVRFYTLRRSVGLFNALQRNRADFSTGFWLWYRSYQPKRRNPWGGKSQPWALMGCLFASISHPARAKGGHERPLHCLET